MCLRKHISLLLDARSLAKSRVCNKTLRLNRSHNIHSYTFFCNLPTTKGQMVVHLISKLRLSRRISSVNASIIPRTANLDALYGTTFSHPIAPAMEDIETR